MADFAKAQDGHFLERHVFSFSSSLPPRRGLRARSHRGAIWPAGLAISSDITAFLPVDWHKMTELSVTLTNRPSAPPRHSKFPNHAPSLAAFRCSIPGTSKRFDVMIRSLAYLACILLIAAIQPAFASPQTDAEYIAADLINSADFKAKLLEMAKDAQARDLAAALSKRSVRITDNEKLLGLLPVQISDPMIEHIRQAAVDRLAQRVKPAQLASLAEYLRNTPPAMRSAKEAGLGDRVLTIEEFQQEIAALAEGEALKNDIALTFVGVLLIHLAVREVSQIDTNLASAEIADMLEVDGVFGFPNRIVRQDLIRELRAANP
jgi:hypothetical protein